MPNIQIAVINASTTLADNVAQKAIPALQTQVHRDFAPIWGVDADLAFVEKGSNPPPGAWWLVVLDNSDQAGALGYHDLTSEGLPLGKVFAASDQQYGLKWTVTASHELLEMLGDPDINLAAYVQNDDGTMNLYAYEVCDACEADQYGYDIDGTTVSNFVFPVWFESFRAPQSAQFDCHNQIAKPFGLLPGGYIGVYDVATGSGWHQVVPDGQEHQYQMRPRLGSRRERRGTPRSQWLRSTAHPIGRAKAGGAN